MPRRDGGDAVQISNAVELQSLIKSSAAQPVGALGGRDRDIASFSGYAAPLGKTLLFYALVVLTAGTVYLFTWWFPRLRVALMLTPCPLCEAQFVLVELADRRQELVPVSVLSRLQSINVHAGTSSHTHAGATLLGTSGDTTPASSSGSGKVDASERMLDYRCGRYLYSHAEDTFLSVPGMPAGFQQELAAAASARHIKGQLTDEWERAGRASLYGPNVLRIPVASRLSLLAKEMMHPFYVFQYASVLIWCLEEYYS